MFWGITLEPGKVYSQIVEMPFHISMAALGFTNTAEATTVMVESDKAEYAICTLQAGRIPQQALDLNFTEGEEVKFFLQGNGGDVHLTGYLLETPREYEYEEDDDEELDGLLSSEDESSSMESNQEGNDGKDDSDDEEEISVKNEVDIDREDDDMSQFAIKEERITDSGSDEDESIDSDVAKESLSWQAALVGDFEDDDEDSNSEDNEWKPIKKTSRKKSVKSVPQQKKKARTKQPLSQTLVDLMGMDDSENDSDSDTDWAPASDAVSIGTVNASSKDSSLNGDHCS